MGLKEKLRDRWNTRDELRQKRRDDEYQRLVAEEKKLDEKLKLINKRRLVKEKKRKANPILRRLSEKPKPQPKKKKKRSKKRKPDRIPQEEPGYKLLDLSTGLPDLRGDLNRKKKRGLLKL